MKILVVGAGAVGGYYGARLHEKGEDVTFLVRPTRKKQLVEDGLVVESVNGDIKIEPNLIVAGEEGQFDIVLVSTKSYHLAEAIVAVKPFTNEKSVIIPMLNGIAHIQQLQEAFSVEQVLGGVCFIESTVTNEGVIKQTSGGLHHFLFGELNGESTERMKLITDTFANTKAIFKASDSIMTELWHKYLFITTMSGVTTLFQQPVGPIRELPEGIEIVEGVLNELVAVVRAEGADIASDVVEILLERFNKLGYKMKSSMQRDMEKGSNVEVDHIQGYMQEKARIHAIDTPILDCIYTNLKLYELGL